MFTAYFVEIVCFQPNASAAIPDDLGSASENDNLHLVGHFYDILDKLCPSTLAGGYKSLIKFVNERLGQDRRYTMDNSKISTQSDCRPRVSLDAAMRRTVAWYLDRSGLESPTPSASHQ